MDAIVNIFLDLGYNNSFFIMFGLTVVGFLLLRVTFLARLQEVLETREEKTTKLETHAESQFQEIDRLSKEYTEKLESAYKQTRQDSMQSKDQFSSELNKEFKVIESEVNVHMEKERTAALAEIEEKSKAIMNEAQGLSEALVSKLAQ